MTQLNRAPFNALIDDSGDNLTGTIWNKGEIKGVILDPVDAALAALDAGDAALDARLDVIEAGGTGGGSTDLDYVGDYVPATYNNGDIVVAADGIAYLCVKDGTATPPEAWPGGGGGGGGAASSVLPSAATGVQNDWAPGLSGNTTIFWNGAALLTVTGFAGGVLGQIVTFKNTGTQIATFAHNSSGSAAANRQSNTVTSGSTPVASGGWIKYQHDGTSWVLVDHEQGAWVTPAYAAGDFTANAGGTWGVDAADILANRFRLSGRTMEWAITIQASDVGGAPTFLQKSLFGYQAAGRFDGVSAFSDAGSANAVGLWAVTGAGVTNIAFYKPGAAASWTATALDNTLILASGSVDVL